MKCEKKVKLNKSDRETKRGKKERERRQKYLFVTANRCKELARR